LEFPYPIQPYLEHLYSQDKLTSQSIITAVECNNLLGVSYMASVNIPCIETTALDLASQNNNQEIVEFLLSIKAPFSPNALTLTNSNTIINILQNNNQLKF
jgi:hypothetical protein